METRLIVLKLLLDTLGIPSDILTVDDRKRVQKGVYLGQITGVDLGYRFGWYLKGPYSPALTKDYYSLAEAIAAGDREYESVELQDGLVRKLKKAAPLVEAPRGVPLSPEDWLELLSSVHYLQKVAQSSKVAAEETLKAEKPRLVKYFKKADSVLHKAGLLP
jgi:uncharacterized protein YwgA